MSLFRIVCVLSLTTVYIEGVNHRLQQLEQYRQQIGSQQQKKHSFHANKNNKKNNQLITATTFFALLATSIAVTQAQQQQPRKETFYEYCIKVQQLGLDVDCNSRGKMKT